MPQNVTIPAAFGGIVCEISNTESYVGKDDGKTRYVARVEVPAAEGSRWGTVRVSVLSDAPIPVGKAQLVVRVYDGNKGEARAAFVRSLV